MAAVAPQLSISAPGSDTKEPLMDMEMGAQGSGKTRSIGDRVNQVREVFRKTHTSGNAIRQQNSSAAKAKARPEPSSSSPPPASASMRRNKRSMHATFRNGNSRGGDDDDDENAESTKAVIPSKYVHLTQRFTAQRSIFNKKAEKRLEENDTAFAKSVTSGLTAWIIQGVLLVGAVAAYTGAPVVGTFAKQVEIVDSNGESFSPRRTRKVSTYMEVWAIFWMKLLMAIIGLIYAWYTDRTYKTRGKFMKMLFDRKQLRNWYGISLMWCLADVSEQMAAGRVEPSMYIVLSQGRLLFTALMVTYVFGPKTTPLQWSILTVITIVVISWSFIPDTFGVQPETSTRTNTPVGLAATLVKMITSIIAGVLAQKNFQLAGDQEIPPFLIQQAHHTGLGVFWMLILIPAFIFFIAPDVINEPWWDHRGYSEGFFGMFGAPPYCRDGTEIIWATGECLNPEMTVRIEGWNYRIFIVVAFAMYRDYMANYILKVFDSIIKNLCSAMSTVCAYAIDCVFFGKEFNIVKGMLAVVLTIDITNYAIAGIKPKVEVEVADTKTADVIKKSMYSMKKNEKDSDSDSDDSSSSDDEENYKMQGTWRD